MKTLEDIEAIQRDYLLASEIAPYLNLGPQSIRYQAQEEPQKLGFPVIVCGNHVKIPKQPFINFMCGDIRDSR